MKGIEQVEIDSRNNEQVHGGNVRRVLTQEGSPSLAGRRPSFDHVLGDARLRLCAVGAFAIAGALS
jgi:hypothetical protein